jgi:hypothetical protein
LTDEQRNAWELILKCFAGVAALVVFFWGVWNYFLNKKMEIEFAISSHKVEIYRTICRDAALMATTSTASTPKTQWGPLHEDFYILYCGEFSIFCNEPNSITYKAVNDFEQSVGDAEKIDDPTTKAGSFVFPADALLKKSKATAIAYGEQLRNEKSAKNDFATKNGWLPIF